MADLDAYWSQIKSSEKFQDLEPDKKEQVRQHLFNQYVQKAPSYSSLPQSQRLKVKSHFDEVTKIEPEGFVEGIERKAKPLIRGAKIAGMVAKPLVKDYAERAKDVLDPRPLIDELGEVVDSGEEIPGAKKAASSVRGAFEESAKMVEPSEEGYMRIGKDSGTIKSWNPLTQFDMARAVAAGAIRGTGELIAGAIPETTMGAALFFIDPVFKYAGTTFLGKELTLPWKPKSGLSAADNSMGAMWEKAFTKETINQHVRSNIDAMKSGPPAPLEVLGHKEEMLKAQDQINGYEEWLKQADDLNAKGGEPSGDLHPEAKVNVSQLRDAAKERLQRLQDEPVRVESLSKAEDALQGYYRRRIDQARVWMQPEASVPRETQAMLPGGPKPAGLLKAGEKTKTKPMPERPAEPTPAPNPITPGSTAAPAKSLPQVAPVMAKDVLTEAYSAYHPEATKQAIGIRVGAYLKTLRDELGIDVKNPLRRRDIDIIGKLLEQEHADLSAKEALPKPKKASNIPSDMARLKEKGLDPLEVQAEAKRLQAEHDAQHLAMAEGRVQLKDVTGGVALNQPDPMTGKIPEAEEIRTGIPGYLRGTTPPDEAAQMAYDAGIIPEPTFNALRAYAQKFEGVERHRSAKSFLDEAEYRLEMQNHQEAGFKPTPEQASLPGTPGAQMPKTGLGGAEGQVPTDALLESFKNQDIQQKSLFDVISDAWENRPAPGEGGGFNTEEFDPQRQAAFEASVKELVSRARALGYETTQDIMLYAARNAPKELQNAMRKNLAPTLSPFDAHAYQELEAAKNGNPIAKKSLMDSAQRSYLKEKWETAKGTYKKFKANQQIAMFKDGDEGLMKLKNDLFMHDNYRKFTKDEAAAQMWYMQEKLPAPESLKAALKAKGIPEENAEKWLELARHPTPQMIEAKKNTQFKTDEAHDLISQYYDEMGYVEHYVTQVWERPEEYLDWEGKRLAGKPNITKQRVFVTEADGINAGQTPKTFDVRDKIRAMNRTQVNILSRIHAYQKLGAALGPDSLPAMMDESADLVTQARNAKLTPHRGEAPRSWLRFPGVPLLNGIAVNPHYKEVVQYMMARPFTGTATEVLNFAAASTKEAKLLGLFHGFTQAETFFSGVNYRNVFSFNKEVNPMVRALRYTVKAATESLGEDPLSKNPIKAVGQLYKSFMDGHGALSNRALALDMAEHNFKVGSIDDDVHGILSKNLVKLEGYLSKKIGEKAAKGLTALPRNSIDVLHKGIFSYMRTIGSMIVYEDNLADAIKTYNLEMPEGQKMPIEQIKKQISLQTSNSMGGLTYAQFMAHPKTQQVLQWAMLAPQWTIGRVQMATTASMKGPAGNMARKQMARLFIGWYFVSNAMNYANTQKYLGKGRWMSENPEGYRDQAFRKKDKDGTSYYQMSKALTEIGDDILHPAKTAVNKLGVPVQELAKVMDWGREKFYYPDPSQKPKNPLGLLKDAYTPMFMSGQSAYGAVPVHHGPSRNYVKGMLYQYYSEGMKDKRLYHRALQIGQEQGFDVYALDDRVQADMDRTKDRAMFK